MKLKHILILGAGIYQVPLIRRAVDSGYNVTVASYGDNYPGMKIAHNTWKVDTRDRETLLNLAKKNKIDAVITTGTDVAIPTVGYICDHLGLPGVSFRSAEIMANKHLFRDFLRKKQLPHPNYVVGEEFIDVKDKLKSLKLPIIFKPVDTSGSRGLGVIKKYNSVNAYEKFKYAKGFSRSGLVCAEEFIDGIEVGGDGILHDSQFIFISITHKHCKDFVVTGHSLPTNISAKDQERVRYALEKCCGAIAYKRGPLNFDVMVTSEQIIILEMSARNGGNGIPAVIKRATGIDVEEATLQMAMGKQEMHIGSNLKKRSCGSLIFGSEYPGIFHGVTNIESLQTKIPEVFDMVVAIEKGQKIKRFNHNGNMIGYILFDCPEPTGYEEIAGCIRSSICLKILPGEDFDDQPD